MIVQFKKKRGGVSIRTNSKKFFIMLDQNFKNLFNSEHTYKKFIKKTTKYMAFSKKKNNTSNNMQFKKSFRSLTVSNLKRIERGIEKEN